MESRVEFEIGVSYDWIGQQQYMWESDICHSENTRRRSLSLPDLEKAEVWMKTRRSSSHLGISSSPEESPSKKLKRKKSSADMVNNFFGFSTEIFGDKRHTQSSAEVDKCVVVSSLLSCITELGYLNRINGDQVEIDDTFCAKYILFFCFKMPELVDDLEITFPHYLIEACSELYRTRDDFEMLVVIKDYDSGYEETYFNSLLSRFPPFSLAVPFRHSKIRRSVCQYLHLVHPGFKCLLVNVNKNILQYGNPAIEHLYELFPVRPIEFQTFFDRLVKSTWPVVSTEAKNPRPREGKCPIARSMKGVMPEYLDDIKNMVFESRKSRPLEIGESFDVTSLLSGKGEMNYLDRNDGDPVEIKEETFRGKYIMVCCFRVPIFREDFASLIVQALVTTCFDLYSTRNDFEMVVVVKMNNKADYEAVFNHFLSGFPSCLVVPFKDSKRRDFICKYLELDDCCFIKCLVLDADDKKSVLRHGPATFMLDCGSDAFPFTEEKYKELRGALSPFLTSPSTSNLEGLLGCNASYVLDKINPEGDEEKITVSELNKRVVGLYLCVGGSFIPTLHEVHQQCIKKQLPFEIVLVYLPFKDCLDPHVYKANIDCLLKKKKVSWWCLPFNNSVSRKFWVAIDCHCDNKLIIVGPHNEYVEPYGGEVLSSHRIDGYPFTREGLVQREVKKLNELTLESLLVVGSKNYVYKGSTTVPLADLQGKNVLLFFDSLEDLELYNKLLTWYGEIQADDDDFEVVFVRLDNGTGVVYDDLDVAEYVKPWCVCPYNPVHKAILREKIFRNARVRNTLVKFGTNGRICSFRAQYHLSIHGSKAFQGFGDPHLRQDVIYDLKNFHLFVEDMK